MYTVQRTDVVYASSRGASCQLRQSLDRDVFSMFGATSAKHGPHEKGAHRPENVG